ncbi:(3R)-hydroxymyristoyl-[acyl-carrier-protein] dehydratase [Serratia rubidaea]|uniref:(3R)-hydroxymyristoyl-[acyl-carrier-protein] dehydratase n=1 Tax=Serratia rubidaea TaxID=61652 RepID=A0A447QUG6_SERRU|nr:3-hydroxyacyl-ACP dehydratase FabZ family protein [Serratia rubidaea]MBD8454982.1 beta-hydroxyacyl-ACP dehydratase [Serratia rubidaea]MBH1932567.1 beta-hydroxyacyl-ACP dehydratase [Serratia rubidaea]MBS0974691.1 beta-hydroxyacyl-ACP dehydratase [Serratia rubidaea]MCR0998213.1 beta-hydroxyacyl-ACP dehydratase [Serratia rubidaea]MDC6110880.1 beta-hydroxyacyl-ACP dehydratase [Serratia rubidaea]
MANYNKSLVTPSVLLRMGAWRAPIFMVDRIVDFTPGEKGSITVIKHVTFNEPYIPGHFPDNPVMPGVLIAEIFGQASEYFSLLCDYCQRHERETATPLKKFDEVARSLANAEGVERVMAERHRIIGFLASQDVKYRHVVNPGDTIEVHSKLAFADPNGFHHYEVEARVGRHIACAGRIVNFRIDRSIAEAKGIQIN